MKKIVKLATALIALTFGSLAHAGGHESWKLDNENSRLSFGSIKKDTVGEVHHFQELSGKLAENGQVELEINLGSVETWIDIRNSRILEHVFGDYKTATLSATVDMEEVKALAVGDSTVLDMEGQLDFLGQTIDLESEIFVARLGKDRLLASTNDMIFLSTEEAGLNAGVDVLKDLASLPGITRTVPITLRAVFTATHDHAAAEPESHSVTVASVGAADVIEGDIKKGKKLYRGCKACHSLKAGKNGVGPSLNGIIGASAAAVEGYKYSKAMKDSGLVWDQANLTAFLSNPKGLVKGTKMQYRGIKKESDIQDLLAYIQSQS
ncbi:c-type cytochrome [Kiloniella sp. b19]|uniref:c-type cytochrome n=1 Tax=Kiloniella sp. GXU_MW_B19 TaxID=3141326 RepID=UPI0031CF664A